MRNLIFFLLLISDIFAVVITGNQEKVSVIGGSINVTGNDGVTQIVNSGQITYINEQGASKARKIQKGDLNDVYNDLNAIGSKEIINLKYPPVKYEIARKIKTFLAKKGIPRDKINLKQFKNGTQIILINIQLKSIKSLYPPYYKAAKAFFKKPSNKNKIPTVNMKLIHMKKYHRKIFIKYG